MAIWNDFQIIFSVWKETIGWDITFHWVIITERGSSLRVVQTSPSVFLKNYSTTHYLPWFQPLFHRRNMKNNLTTSVIRPLLFSGMLALYWVTFRRSTVTTLRNVENWLLNSWHWDTGHDGSIYPMETSKSFGEQLYRYTIHYWWVQGDPRVSGETEPSSAEAFWS